MIALEAELFITFESVPGDGRLRVVLIRTLRTGEKRLFHEDATFTIVLGLHVEEEGSGQSRLKITEGALVLPKVLPVGKLQMPLDHVLTLRLKPALFTRADLQLVRFIAGTQLFIGVLKLRELRLPAAVQLVLAELFTLSPHEIFVDMLGSQVHPDAVQELGNGA